jgi:hypothetical protein
MIRFSFITVMLLAILATPSFAGQAKKGDTTLSPQDKQLTELLVSSSWCSFNYSKSTSSSSITHRTFTRDGVLEVSSMAESSALTPQGGRSISGGGFFNENAENQRLRWKVEGGQLWLDAGDGFKVKPLLITHKSDGSPVIRTDGKDYSPCK